MGANEMETLSLTVGLELETTGGGSDALEIIADAIGIDHHPHPYHCGCREQCDARIDRPNIVTAQDDCTVEMEFITRPMVLGDAQAWAELALIGEAFRQSRTYADPHENAGQHVHVGAGYALDELTPRRARDFDGEVFMADGREQLAQLFIPLQEALRPYMAASVDDVREYNHPLSKNRWNRPRQAWLNLNYNRPTVEIRGWNGSIVPWRWRMSAGISAAMCAAVLDGARPTRKAKPTLAGELGKHLDDETRELMSRQMFYRLKNY
jgi:hypothetical protein